MLRTGSATRIKNAKNRLSFDNLFFFSVIRHRRSRHIHRSRHRKRRPNPHILPDYQCTSHRDCRSPYWSSHNGRMCGAWDDVVGSTFFVLRLLVVLFLVSLFLTALSVFGILPIPFGIVRFANTVLSFLLGGLLRSQRRQLFLCRSFPAGFRLIW